MKMKLAAVIIFLVAGAAFLVISSSGDAGHPHYQLKEFHDVLKTNPQKLQNRYMTVYGNVKEGTIERKGIKANFVIEKDGKELPIFFTGKTLLPDTFKEGSEATIDGKYDMQKNIFIADKVMAKCASKYKSIAEDES
ncbi:MAG: cytochrome c maturation protein CcmE [Spirochaetia bacterium]|nr:cytochrome c maturation protein CcmE [Spirochaetia bacterium]